MTHEQFIQYHKEMCERMMTIVAKKNHDYSGKSSAAFENFQMVERLGVASTTQGFLVRMMDKYMRVNNFCKSGVLKVDDEKIEDTLLDLANYSLLMAGYIKSLKSEQF